MTVAEFLQALDDKKPPISDKQRLAFDAALAKFEAVIEHSLPADYKKFLVQCNGGYVGGKLLFNGPTPEGEAAEVGVDHVGGFRKEDEYSLSENRDLYEDRIPAELVWVMDDPFGNAICLGLTGQWRGKVYFWDHENEPDDEWDGEVATAGNLQLLADSFSEFVGGLQPNEEDA